MIIEKLKNNLRSKMFGKDKKWDEKSSGEKSKKYPKPWTQETHDQFIKDKSMTKEEHDEWHRQQEKSE